MNHGEARFAGSLLSGMGHDVVYGLERPWAEDLDGVILFTCDVISSTERRMWKLMDNIQASGTKLYAAGCLASIDGEKVLARYPGSCVLDTMGLDRTERSVKRVFEKVSEHTIRRDGPIPSRLDHIVPISSGCVGACTYCITREARGPPHSNSQREIVAALRKGLDEGRKEILLTSQDTGAWGIDLGKGDDLGTLLRFISSSVCEEMRIRVGMMNPNHLLERSESILNGYTGEKIFKFFHIPVQSGSVQVLRRMNRRYTPSQVMEVLGEVRARYPQATISTDVITGFPGETEKDHELTMELISRIRPDILNITRFSARKGTPAADMDGQVHGGISKERSRDLHRSHGELVKGNLERRLGLHPHCLVTEVGKEGTMMARDGNYTPIVIGGGSELLGRFVDIRTEHIGPTYLFGKIV